jgi:hypothetical protein
LFCPVHKFTINKITKLIKQHEDRKQKSKELSASKPLNYELTAKMIWAKNHKELVNQYKIYLGATSISTIKTYKDGTSKEIIKYIIPNNKKQEYSAWLLQQVQSDPYFITFEQSTYAKSDVQQKLNEVIDYLQIQQSPPRYLTINMKTYVKRMFTKGATNEEVYAYIVKIQNEIPYGVLDPITRKLHKKSTLLPVPIGVAPILKPIKYIKLPASSRQPASPIIPIAKTLSPKTHQMLHKQNIINTQTQIPQVQTQTQNLQFQLPQSPTNYKSPVNVPTISSPKVNMQM